MCIREVQLVLHWGWNVRKGMYVDINGSMGEYLRRFSGMIIWGRIQYHYKAVNWRLHINMVAIT